MEAECEGLSTEIHGVHDDVVGLKHTDATWEDMPVKLREKFAVLRVFVESIVAYGFDVQVDERPASQDWEGGVIFTKLESSLQQICLARRRMFRRSTRCVTCTLLPKMAKTTGHGGLSPASQQ